MTEDAIPNMSQEKPEADEMPKLEYSVRTTPQRRLSSARMLSDTARSREMDDSRSRETDYPQVLQDYLYRLTSSQLGKRFGDFPNKRF